MDSVGWLVNQGFEFVLIDRVGEKGSQLAEVLIGREGVSSLEEAISGCISREDLAERFNLAGVEALGFEYLKCGSDALIVFWGLEHLYPKLIYIIIGGKGVAV